MTKKQKKQQSQNFEDDYEFLLKAASENQQKKREVVQKELSIQQEKMKFTPDLPSPPSDVFPNNSYPEGELLNYDKQLWRSTNQDLIEIEKIQYLESVIPDLREGAEIHRKVRQYAVENIIKPGVVLYDMCSQIEEAVRQLSHYQPKIRGLAFPCGCSLNNCAAHYTPLSNDLRTLKEDDVMKIDFGVNVNGSIIDSAFTICFDPRFDSLIQASKDATNAGLKLVGIDARMSEIGDVIHEVIESASFEINGKHFDCKPVSNLSGHLIKPYLIHAGKSIPICRGGNNDKMEEGEIYALETFATTGKGKVNDDYSFLSHYMVSPNPHIPRTPQQRKLLKNLQDNFSTLAFCPRFIEHYGEKKYQISLKQLVENHSVTPFPALLDVKGSYVSQSEHTFILLPTHKEILSRGNDY